MLAEDTNLTPLDPAKAGRRSKAPPLQEKESAAKEPRQLEFDFVFS